MAAQTLTRVERKPREAVRTTEYDRRVKLFNRICLGVLIACAILWLVPLAWAFDTALKPNAETTKVTWGIDNPTFAAFARVFQETDMLNWYVSSFLTSALTAAVVVVTGSMAAFALSRMTFRFKNVVFWFILIGIMIPGQVLIVPQFREFDAVHLLNTYWAVILPQAPTAIAVFIFKQFFDGLPRDLDDAAKVDGASYFRLYRTVALPLARPAVAAVAIFTFVTTWNNLLWPLLVLSNPKLMTVPVGMATVQGNFGIRYADTMATAVLGALPLVVVFLLFQRHIVQGIAGTGLKAETMSAVEDVQDTLTELREQVCRLHAELTRYRLVAWTAGNVSARVPDRDLLVIKPSGVSYDDLTPENMVVCDLDGRVVEGEHAPSSDTEAQAYVYREMSEVGGVVHTHSTYATAWAARREPVPCVLTMGADEFGGEIPVGPFAVIGDDTIGRGIVETLRGHRSPAVLMANHGVFAIGPTARAAVKAAVMCEDVARTVHISRQLGTPVPVEQEYVDSLYDRYQNVYGQR